MLLTLLIEEVKYLAGKELVKYENKQAWLNLLV